MKTYVFLSNIMYNSMAIRRVRWWHKLFGHAGEVVLDRVDIDQADNEDGFRKAVIHFRSKGLEAQVMGIKLHKGIL